MKTGESACLVIANAENAAGGFGLTQRIYKELISSGIDILTGGNHIWDKVKASDGAHFSNLAAPANLPSAGGAARALHVDFQGIPFSIINLVGRVFMSPETIDPFKTFDSVYTDEKCEGRLVLVDFHAEATSEKIALAEYTAGRAAAVIGTHTHVQTADNRILRNGAFFISDAGSCAAVDSILGMTTESSLSRFRGKPHHKMKVETEGPVMMNGVRLLVDADKMKIVGHERIYLMKPD